MDFERRYDFKDTHAFLSPSKYHWINYDKTKLEHTYKNWKAAAEGVRRHEFAKEAIEMGIKLPRTSQSLNAFVNDAIGYRMTPEIPLMYSENFYGTADAISFNRNLLRIHDYKSGVTKSSMLQVELYAVLFCLDYDVNPDDIDMELRIYQNDIVDVYTPEPGRIRELMDIAIHQDMHINSLK